MSIQKLIDQTYSYMVEAVDDLKDLYKSDYEDFIKVQIMLEDLDVDGVVRFVEHMDTEPREQILLAMLEERGTVWVKNKMNVRVI